MNLAGDDGDVGILKRQFYPTLHGRIFTDFQVCSGEINENKKLSHRWDALLEDTVTPPAPRVQVRS